MSSNARTVLITGCSDGGMGAALAVAFHEAGLKVYATARNPSKMASLVAHGIETLTLDIESESSIAECVQKLPNLDILVNNAAKLYVMPVADISISEAKKIHDINVWAQIAMTQAVLPLLLKSSGGMIVNHTSVGAAFAMPFQAVYNSSKAALAIFSDSLRLELEPFGIKVVELRTAHVKTNIAQNLRDSQQAVLPEGSIYTPAKDALQDAMRQESYEKGGMPAEQWAKQVVQDLLKKNPPPLIYRGDSALMARIGTMLPFGMLDSTLKKLTGLDAVSAALQNRAT